MNGKCPKCNRSSGIPLCLNCGKDSLTAQRYWGTYALVCRSCDMTYSHATCPACGCQIPARAYAAPSFTLIIVLIFLVLLLAQFFLKTCCQ